MIQTLIDTLRARLAGPLTGVHLFTGPLAAEPPPKLPALVFSPGAIEITPGGGGEAADEPRPQPARELIPVQAGQTGPFTLNHPPLRDSLRVRAISDPGLLTERQTLLQEGQDFALDPATEHLTLLNPPSAPLQLAVDYSFVGIFGLYEFKQTLTLDAFGADMGTAEKWASLTISAVLTSMREWLEASNEAGKSGYRASPFSALHRVHQMQFVEGVPAVRGNAFKVQLTFVVGGQTRIARDITDGFGIIEAIQSPGKTNVVGVEVDVKVGI